jgi:hypothetical protein
MKGRWLLTSTLATGLVETREHQTEVAQIMLAYKREADLAED